ncbi:MAG TPA: ATP-binding protein [Smithellaceae bacterium]|nr:ATP-binding protein [Smithellaceae bacterium]HQM45899.1 ATP-binding protein [Smithellaceae bacterium]
MQNYLLIFIVILAIITVISFIYTIWRARNDEQILRNIIQGSPIPTFVISTDHKILHWNKALEGLNGIKASQVLGTNQQWRAFYSKQRDCMADLILNGRITEASSLYSGTVSVSKVLKDAYEVTEFFPDIGEKGKWFRITAASIRDSSGRIFGAMETLEDITEQKATEEELLKRTKLESLGTFADGVAKDFDSLLTAILRNVFLAKISANEEDKILENGLAIAERAGLQAKELAHRLITFAQGGYPVKKMEQIGELIRETVQKVLSGSNIACEPVIADNLWPTEIDVMQIKQVVENMITNAKEAMPNGGVVEVIAENTTTGTNIRTRGGSTYVRIMIRDRGVGIPRENLSRIFDPYFTTKEKKERGGIGLGLAICDSIIKYHNGLITVESQVGFGTTFFIYLAATPDNPPKGQDSLS